MSTTLASAMRGRHILGSASRLGPLALVGGWALLANAAPALAQTASETPEAPLAPAAPPVAPPQPDPPAPAPSVPAPPNQAPTITEPTPAPTPSSPPPSGSAVSNAEPASGSAAFAPLPAETAAPNSAPANSAPATPPPASEAPPARAAAISHVTYDESAKDDDSDGLLGPFRIGVLVGTGLPEVANFGAQLKLTRFVGVGVNVGLIPTVRLNFYGDAALKYQEYDAYAHIYPFGGSFFLGAGVGYAQVDGTLVNHFNLADLQQPGISGSFDVTSDASVRTMVLTPQLGFLKIFDVGFAIGVDVGAQIPIAPSEVQFNTAAPGVPAAIADVVRRQYINPNDEKVRSTLNTVGRTPLPTFNFKLGWFL